MAYLGSEIGVRIFGIGTYPVIFEAINSNEPAMWSSQGEATCTADNRAGNGCAATEASATCSASLKKSGTLAG